MLRTSSTKFCGLNRHSTRLGRCISKAYSSNIDASEPIEHYDAVIIGGGPVGLALACSLGSSRVVNDQCRIALVEASDLSKTRNWSLPTGSFSNRVSSITNSSLRYLQKSGAWSSVDENRVQPINEMQVWDGLSDARIVFKTEESSLLEADQMAWLTENLNLQHALLTRLNELPAVSLIDKVKVDAIQPESAEIGSWPIVMLSDRRKVRARLLIGADGFNSPVKQYTGINSYGWSYDRQAIVATLRHEARSRQSFQNPHSVAYQRFLPTGPIACLPLSPTVSSLVWTTTPELAKIMTGLDGGVVSHMINAAFRLPDVSIKHLHNVLLEGSLITEAQLLEEIQWRERSHSIDSHSSLSSSQPNSNTGVPLPDAHLYPPLVQSIEKGTIASFPLRFSHAESYLGEGNFSRTVLVGDAAHTVHPLAGQGLNMGLADVEVLSRCIENALRLGGDIGARTTLLPYAQNRYFENHKIMSAIDKLHKIYSTTFKPIVWARSVGLEVINELDTVKAAFMMTAGASTRASDNGAAWKTLSGLYQSSLRTGDALQFVARTAASGAAVAFDNLAKMLRR